MAFVGDIGKAVRRAAGKAEWKEPPRAATRLSIRDLEKLGEVRGQAYYRHPKGELVADRGTLRDDRDVLPDRPYLQADADGIRTYQAMRWLAPGSYERIVNAPAPTITQAKPLRPVDALAGHPLLDRGAEVVVAPPASRVALPSDARMPAVLGTRRVRGAAQIVDRLARKGIVVGLDTTRTALVVTGPDGYGAGCAALVRDAAPLLVAHLRGEPATCTVTEHEPPAEAVTTTVGGALACQPCMTGVAS